MNKGKTAANKSAKKTGAKTTKSHVEMPAKNNKKAEK